VVDAGGNLYSTGLFSGTVNFNPNNGKAQTLASGGAFVSKLTSAGNYVTSAGMGSGSNNGRAIALDGAGNVYVTGVFSGTSDFDPTSATHTLTSNGSGDAFVAKLTQSGTGAMAGELPREQFDVARPSTVAVESRPPLNAKSPPIAAPPLANLRDLDLHGVRVDDQSQVQANDSLGTELAHQSLPLLVGDLFDWLS